MSDTFTVTPGNPLTILNVAGEKQMTIEAGAAEGGSYFTLYLHNGDLAGLRNIQGGSIDTGQADDVNLDIGAGNAVQRGWVSVAPDVGKGLIVGSGRNRQLAKFAGSDDPAKDLITLHAATRIRELWVPKAGGGWRRAAL